MPESLSSLARRRGLYVPASGAYGGVSGFYTYGPRGAAIKRNVEAVWRDRFVRREGNDEIDSPTIVPEAVFEASGHLDHFTDAVVGCPDCDARHRADHLIEDHTDTEDAEALAHDVLETHIAEHDLRCPDCGAALAGQSVESFDLLFETEIGPGNASPGYLRPETAQGTLVEFPRLREYARDSLPFGVAQIGRGYRNEISPRNAIVRMRELTMAELQRFFDPREDDPPLERVAGVTLRLAPADREDAGDDVETTVGEAVETGRVDPAWLAYYLGVAREWLERVGVDPERLRFRQHREDELAHYATDCWDAEARVDGEWIELAGIAYRADHDLETHADHTDEAYAVFREYDKPRERERTVVDPDMSALGPRFGDAVASVVDALDELAERDPAAFEAGEVVVAVDGEEHAVATEHVEVRTETVCERGEHVRPHVVEPAIGIDRVVYASLAHNRREDVLDDDSRTRLALPPGIAPVDVAVFPLRDDLADRAREVVDRLRRDGFDAEYDDAGSIGRRYRRQDEIGTPHCVTLDERTPEDDTVTVRDRDSTKQVRVPIADLPGVLDRLAVAETTLDALGREYERVED